jgi:hypothetical protein
MRKILLVFLMSVVFAGTVLPASGRERGYYEIRRGVVMYNGTVVREADPVSFMELGYGYAKDRSHVFMNGQVLPYVDPDGFRVDKRFESDGWQPEDRNPWHDSQHPGSCPQRPGNRPGPGTRPPLVHKPEGRSYVVTRFEVLWDGKALPGVSASTFKDLGWGYGKDAFDVWWCGRKMPDATVYSFSVLGDGYAIDAFSVWYCGQEIKDAVSGSFRVLGDGYAEDGFNTYYYGKKVR